MRRAASAVAVVACLSVAACGGPRAGAGSTTSAGTLRSVLELSGDRTGLGLAFAEVGEVRTVGVPSLCGPVAGQVTSVTLAATRGLRLVDVGARVESEAKGTVGSDTARPAALGFYALPFRYSAPCPQDGDVPRALQLVISLAPTGADPASASGVRVDYTENGTARSRVIDFPLTACVTKASQCPTSNP